MENENIYNHKTAIRKHFVVGEEHATTAKNEANTNKGGNCDGGTASRSTKPIKQVAAVAGFSVYPNPITNGSFTVSLPKSSASEALNWYITVTDVYGKVVLEKQLTTTENKLSINTAKGLYIATLYNKSSGKQLTSKIIVE